MTRTKLHFNDGTETVIKHVTMADLKKAMFQLSQTKRIVELEYLK